LTLRNLEAYLQRLSSRLAAEKSTHWWGAVDAAIDEYIAMHRTTPGFRTLHFGDVVDVHLLDDERDNNAVIAARIAALLHERYELATERTEFALGIAVEAADALIKMAFRREPNGDVAVLEEARSLIKEYLHRQVA
jgi:Tetracyclin repressor-like, C-terminal domain